jgi:hypothetical protein
MKHAHFLLFCAFAQAQSTLSAPSIGFMRDPSGAYREVFGIAGTFTLATTANDVFRKVFHVEHLLEREGDSTRILRSDGGVIDIVRTTQPVLLTPHATVYVHDETVVVRRDHLDTVHFAVPDLIDLHPMSEDWVQLITAHGSFALRLTAGHEALFVLPTAVETRRR